MRDIRTKKTRNLSAIGSKNSPNFDSSDFLLAKAPSNASLREPNTKRTTAEITDVVESKKSKVDTNIAKKNLDNVNIVGKYTISFYLPLLEQN